MRQIISTVSPQNISIQSSQSIPSFGTNGDPKNLESMMIKSLNSMKNVMISRFKLDPARLQTQQPTLTFTSQQNYEELLKLIDYLDWLTKYLKNNLVLDSS